MSSRTVLKIMSSLVSKWLYHAVKDGNCVPLVTGQSQPKQCGSMNSMNVAVGNQVRSAWVRTSPAKYGPPLEA